MKTVGERIRQARTAAGMTGEQLAKKCGYASQAGIGNLENSKSNTGGRSVTKIAQALDVPLDWLLRGPDSATVPFLTEKGSAAVIAHEVGASYESWPFTTSRSDFDSLPAAERARIDGYITSVVQLWGTPTGNRNGTHG